MFLQESRARLSEFSDLATVVRDGEFFSIGKVPTRIQLRVVPVGSRANLEEALTYGDQIAGVICKPDLVPSLPPEWAVSTSTSPLAAAYRIHARLNEREDYFWRSFESRVDPSATIAPGAFVAERDVIIGAGTVIERNAQVLPRTIIGERCYVGPGTVVSCLAYELARFDGVSRLVAQAGGVRIGNDVTCLTNTTIAKSVFPVFTDIADHCSFDNLVHVGHDVILEEGVKMAASSMVCGRVYVGRDTFIGPKAIVANGVTIGRQAQLSIGSMISRDVPNNTTVTGYFAVEHALFIGAFKKLHGL